MTVHSDPRVRAYRRGNITFDCAFKRYRRYSTREDGLGRNFREGSEDCVLHRYSSSDSLKTYTHIDELFSDLAGHERYLKTTLYGLTSGAPSCVILIVGGNAGLIGMSKEHLAIALALSVPVIVCITKAWCCQLIFSCRP